MRKILVPTDFSNNAMNALKYALELFKYDIGEFFIMHAYQDEIYLEEALQSLSNLAQATRIVASRSQLQLEELLKQVHDISPNPKHTYKITSVNSTLIDAMDIIIEDENIDIVVMGTRGETNDRKLTFGSHTLQALKYVRCPVLAIPEGYKHIQPRHVLFPTNYLIPYKRRELKLLCEMVHPYRANIDIVHISKSKSKKLSLRQEDNQTFLKEELCKNRLNFKRVYAKSIVDTVYTYVKENNIDLLVMVNNKHTLIENIIFQSTIDKISLHIDIPFLALQNLRRT
ncbi:MAG: universal stress protein [Ignavibacteriae bacterium]|nr:universal stress protein [Ignavibacteriota bacterium]